jgi:hydroxypyruvate isomerase
MKKQAINRREAMERLSATLALALAAPPSISAFSNGSNAPTHAQTSETAAKRQFLHSVCRWCYQDMPLEDFAKVARDLGISSIELLQPHEWATVQKFDLTCAVAFSQPEGFGIKKGFNRIENHKTLLPFYEDLIKKAAAAKIPNVICFSGDREGLNDELGLVNCAKGLREVVKMAEKNGVTVVMELLNSKVDHKDYQCDHTNWGVALCEMVGSERFKLLYDIYHMQIMEGDVIRTIKDAAPYIGHFHTAGVPGRNEIDTTQELYYPAIMNAIAQTGFKGFVAQEFMPKNVDKIASLRQAISICSV